MKKIIDLCFEKSVSGIPLKKDEIIRLLNIEINSEDDIYMRKKARLAAEKINGNSGCLWCAVGMDFVPCSMNCKFCSFGEKWNLIGEERHVTKQEIINHIRQYVAGGAAYVVLRTTEFYDLDLLLKCIPQIRSEVPGDYGIILNTGELDMITAKKVFNAGVYGVYHALRLREGLDTPFDPQVRTNTMRSVSANNLTLASLVEPLGYEHTNEEITDSILNSITCGSEICGVMARFPVKGTPMGETAMIDSDKIAHTVAVVRLATGKKVRDICVHPASEQALNSGANMMVVEAGAIPRDSSFSQDEWLGVNMEKARNLLTAAGYRICPPPAKPTTKTSTSCCSGNSMERFMHPIILSVLYNKPLNATEIAKGVIKSINVKGYRPKMSVIYRHLGNMKQMGLVTSNNSIYSITQLGKLDFDSWKNTIKEHNKTISELIQKLY